MNPQTAQLILQQYAFHLRNAQDEMINEWLKAVHADGSLYTPERLSISQLQHHLPLLFDHLTELLCSPADRETQKEADENARSHGSLRYDQGYRLDELVRELSRIRAILLSRTLQYEEQTPDFIGVAKQVAVQRVHGFMDDLIRDAVAQYVGDQNAGLRERATVATRDRKQAQDDHGKERVRRTVAEERFKELNEGEKAEGTVLLVIADRLQAAIFDAQQLEQSASAEATPSRVRLKQVLATCRTEIDELVSRLNQSNLNRSSSPAQKSPEPPETVGD